jgi:MYXO-CTERM domain-containing protein
VCSSDLGFVTAYPCGITPPRTSSLNFDSDNPAGALSISAIGSGSLCLVANQRTYLIVDLLGVWVPTPDAPPPTDGPGPMPDEPENPDPPMSDVDGGIALPDDAGAPSDAELVTSDARGPDVGESGRLSGSCSCRVPGHGARTPAAGWLALGLASLAWRRGRRRSTRRAP